MDNAALTQLQHKLAHYQLSPQAVEVVRGTPIVLLVGISGAGKDTIKHRLLEEKAQAYHHIVSHTTRAPRRNHDIMEQDGVEYHFIDIKTAEAMVDSRAFIEAKIYSNNMYGTSVAEIRLAHDEGKIAITDLEVQGVEEYVKISPQAHPIFILPPNYDVWRHRLLARYGSKLQDYRADLQKRMQTAREELRHALSVDYFYFVINNNLQQAVAEVDRLAHQPQDVAKQNVQSRAVAEQLLAQISAHLDGDASLR